MRFYAGQQLEIGGFQIRIVAGRKTENDLRMEMLGADGWVPFPMALGFLQADFYHQNEGTLAADGYWGDSSSFVAQDPSRKYREEIFAATQEGWEAVDARLQGQRKARREREAA